MSDKTSGPDIIELEALSWRSSRDDSRPTGDDPTKGDYITWPPHAYRVIEARPNKAGGWSLTCERVGNWEPWAGDTSDYRIFDWKWRTDGGATRSDTRPDKNLDDVLRWCEAGIDHQVRTNGGRRRLNFDGGYRVALEDLALFITGGSFSHTGLAIRQELDGS